MVRESIPEVSHASEIHDYVDTVKSELDEGFEDALEDVEEGRYFIREGVTEFKEGYEVVDASNNVTMVFPSLQDSLDAVVTAQLSKNSGRYGSYSMEEATVVYDKDNPEAWIQSDYTLNSE